ncbi:hypothetical protein SAY87_022300 [Trapa incisa]|uniref:Cell wall hydroxyproline-rich glycoprotein n=2 Tax=Trapa TaxID=22665 RepID=A0AAN7LIG9_TRANT|nr:hypothetical protein SAY87_022300 [Trapa incisa]KAK4783683.1 hypothetical protein SAY86_008057 [Trapa natans]
MASTSSLDKMLKFTILNPPQRLTLWVILSTLLLLTKPSYQQLPYSSYPSNYHFQNPRLEKAYIALQAWKLTFIEDPKNLTANWCGPDVCNYTGVFCAPAPDDPTVTTVAGIDLNSGNISGWIHDDLSLLCDVALIHLNSNRFFGTIPFSFRDLKLLYELDVSNNKLSGGFPNVILWIPSLKYFDIRFNQYSGTIPTEVFDLKLDALFINNNNFTSAFPKNIGNFQGSVIVLANNNFGGCLPSSISKMAATLNEVVFINSGLTGCLPPEIGSLTQVTVFDVSFNNLVGKLPETIGKMKSLEQLNVAHNRLSGEISESICTLPKLENFTFSDNYFCTEPPVCLWLKEKNDTRNCIPYRPEQRPPYECEAFYKHPVDCSSYGCWPKSPPPSRPPPVHYYP